MKPSANSVTGLVASLNLVAVSAFITYLFLI